MKGFTRIFRRVMRDESPSGESAASLRQNYTVTMRRSKRIPGTFTRESPSRSGVDFAWIAMTFLPSIIFAAVSLRSRRRNMWFAFPGKADELDFRLIHPDLIVRYLSNHKEFLQDTIDSGNSHINFLARFIDPLPSFIANPHTVLVAFASAIYLYTIYRFWVQHRNWRFNTAVLIFAYATYFPIRWLSPADSQMSVYLICNWVFPVFAALSVLLHKALRDNKWKLLTVVLELRPKKDGLVREDGDEDTQALLNYDELTRKDDR